MAKLIKLDEAAQLLGISADKLTEMRSRNEIFGYRDGATWKFKLDELERVAQQKGLTLGGQPAAEEELEELVELDEVTLEDESADVVESEENGEPESDSILVSEEELGKSDETTASTIIGEEDLLAGGDSDVRPGEELESGSELRLASDSSAAAEDEGELIVPTSDLLAASDILADEGEKPTSPSDTAQLKPLSGSGDELSLEAGSGSLDLSLEDEQESESGSEFELKGDSKAGTSGFGSAIDLELDDDELVLGSGTGSDVTSGAGDSGINLNHPSDSGLSLEEPLELATGSGVESLELGEDDLAELDKVAAGESKGGHADDDFLLTPVDSGMEEEEGESGSQVIDLDSEEFDDSAAALLAPDEPAVLEPDETVEFTEVDTAAPAAGLAVAATGPAAAESLEAPYTIWNVLSLFFVALLLAFAGILMLDLMNNIWSWQGNYEFNSAIMDAILNLLPGT